MKEEKQARLVVSCDADLYHEFKKILLDHRSTVASEIRAHIFNIVKKFNPEYIYRRTKQDVNS